MRSKSFVLFGVLVTASLSLSARTAAAQTTAVGPYYATPSWDQTLPCAALANCPRFIALSNMNSGAVLDRETGLVWEKSVPGNLGTRSQADVSCMVTVIGNRQGWRVPTVHEFRTLMDPSNHLPALPDGHPFLNVGGLSGEDFYWTSTVSVDPQFPGIYGVSFASAGTVVTINSSGIAHIWCVRGPQ